MKKLGYRVFFMFLLTGCADYAGNTGGSYETAAYGEGGYGATGGGAQDIGFFRSVVAEGQVPYADSFVVEGLLSEHDLPTVGAPCDELLCLRPAMGVAPSLQTGEEHRWIQVGMTSGLAAPFVRPAMDIVLVIDRSGSMQGDLRETMTAAGNIIDQMTDDDRLGVVVFNSSTEVVYNLGPVTDPVRLKNRLNAIQAQGNFDVMPALNDAHVMLRGTNDDPSRLRRIVLFGCNYPQAEGPFSAFLEGAEEDRIGVTVAGILLGPNPDLVRKLGDTRGGTFHFTESLTSIEALFTEDLDFIMTPLAYDLAVRIETGTGWTMDKIIGLPTGPSNESAGFDIKTAFISKRKGGIFVRLTASDGADNERAALLKLSYEPETAHGFSEVQNAQEAIPNIEEGIQSLGLNRGVALINQAEQMAAACTAFHAGEVEPAKELLEELEAYLSSQNDDDLQVEIELVQKLRENMD